MQHIRSIEYNANSEGSFSIYKAPISNTQPAGQITLRQAWKAIRGHRYLELTQRLRGLKEANESEYKRLKRLLLDYVSFAGIFSHHCDNAIIALSGYMCLDFDHLDNLPAKRRKLITDPVYRPVLLFTSPGGDGLKNVVLNLHPHEPYHVAYKKTMDHFFRRYGLAADTSCSNISRACFLCHDPTAFLYDDINTGESDEGWDNIRDIGPDPELKEVKYTSQFVAGSWTEEIEKLETFFHSLKNLDQPFHVNALVSGSSISNFLDANLEVAKAQNGNPTYRPYLNRVIELKQFLHKSASVKTLHE